MDHNAHTAAAASVDSLPTSDDIRAIGEIIRDTRKLNSDQVAKILDYQRKHGVKFGEAAVALGYASQDDVLHALAEQFNYAYAQDSHQARHPELVALNQPFSRQAEAIRAIRAQILLRAQTEVEGVQTQGALAILSPNAGDGKTYFAANLGVALAQLGKRTLIIDADLRSSRLQKLFGLDAGSGGLAGLLSGRRSEGVIRPVDGVANLFVLPVGIQPPNPLELIEGPSFGLLIRELLGKFDHVIVDTPAAELGADGIVAAARCGLALVVARKDHVKMDALRDMVETLSATPAKVVGVVLNEH